MSEHGEVTIRRFGTEAAGPHRPVPLGSHTWSPAVAMGFIGLIILSVVIGIIALLGSFR